MKTKINYKEIRKLPKVKAYEKALINHAISQKEKNSSICYRLHPNNTYQIALDMGLLLKPVGYYHGRALVDLLYNTGLANKLNKIFTEKYGKLNVRHNYFNPIKGMARKRAIRIAEEQLNNPLLWKLQ